MSASAPSVRSIFDSAIEIDSPAQRQAYLDAACAGNPEMRQKVEALLHSHDDAGSFLQVPPPAVIHQCHDATELYSPITEGPGSRIGPYKLLQQIGEGGFGVVYMAEQQAPVRRKVALKIIKPGMDTREVIARFESERQALALMDHPNIAKVLDAGTTGEANNEHSPAATPQSAIRNLQFPSGRPYFVMELVKGIPITQYCDDNHLRTEDRLQLVIQVCNAVQHAHQKGIIHRDLKPSNVMVTMHDGRPVPKVIDFGVAKATSQQLTERTLFTAYGAMIGTPAYMSPEQAELSGLDIDTRSDIYSLGVLLYELLTGTTPFDAKTLRAAGFDEMRRIIREEEPETVSARIARTRRVGQAQRRPTDSSSLPSSTPRSALRAPRWSELDWIVARCLEKDRERRYETASNLAADLQHYLQDEPVVACPPSLAYRFRKFVRRNKIGAAALAAAAAFVVVIAAFGVRQSALAKSEKLARRAAEQETANKRVALNQAQTANDALKQNLYRADTDLAYQAWHAGLADRTVELLERHRPQPGENDIRGFEWFHLWQRSRDYLWSLPVDDLRPKARITFSHQGTRLAIANNNERGGDGIIRGGVHYERWREGKRIDEFGKPIENYQPPTVPKRPPRQGDTVVRIFDARGGILQKTLSYPSCSFGDVVFSHDDNAVVFWSFEGLIAIDASTGALKAKLTRPFADDNAANSPRPLAASPTNAWVVTALDNETVALLDVASMETIRRWPAKQITRLVFSPNGQFVAGWGGDTQVFLWETEKGELKQTVQPTKGTYNASKGGSSSVIAFSSDSNLLAFHERGPHRIAFWDISKGGRTNQEIKVETNSPYADYIKFVLFIPNSNLVAAGSLDGLVRYWDTKTSNLVRQWPGLTMPIASSDGKLLAGHWGNEIRVFEREQRPYRQINAQRDPSRSRADQAISCVAVPGRDTLFAFRSYGPIESWRISTAERVEDLSSLGPEDKVLQSVQRGETNRLAVSPDGKLLALASEDVLRVFTGDNFANQRTFDTKRLSFSCVAISPDKRRIATGGSRRMDLEHHGNLTLWDAKSLQPVFHMDQPWQRMTKAKTRPVIEATGGHPEVTCVAFSPTGKQLASTGDLKEICLWSVETGELQHELWNANGACLTYSPDGSLLACTHDSDSERYMIKLWNPHSGQLVAFLAGHTDRITRLAFSPDGNTLASAGYDGVRLWNVATRERVGFLDDARTSFTSLCFSGDGKTLVAGDRVGRLHFWRADTNPKR